MPAIAVPQRLRSRKAILALVVAVLLVAGLIAWGLSGGGSSYRTVVRMVAGTPEAGGARVQLDTTLYLPDGKTDAPAVLLAHGFGGTKNDVAGTARTLVGRGYVVLAYTARGFGKSGGDIHLDAPDFEVKDAQKLLDYLQQQPEVNKNELAVDGSSYGGGLALLLAGTDPRIKAVAADITWNNLRDALFPNGVFKKLWVGTLFGEGFDNSVSGVLSRAAGLTGDEPVAQGTVSCGRFAPDLCRAYQQAAATGTPDAELIKLMRASSPATVLSKITAPTLLTQGEDDSLFPLGQADANAKGIAAHGTPVKVVWRSGGHDDLERGNGTATTAMLAWFGQVFGGDVERDQPFQFSQQGTTVSSTGAQLRGQIRIAAGYPGIDGTAQRTQQVTLAGAPQQIAAPAGGVPSAITAIPGLSSLISSFGDLLPAASALSVVPAQTAFFYSPVLARDMLIAGSSSVELTITPKSTSDATLFLALRDLDGKTQTLPRQLVTPVKLTGLTPGRPTTVHVELPAIVRDIESGHRLALTVATTDFAYGLPQDARAYTVAIGSDGLVTVPTISAKTMKTGQHPVGWLIAGVAVIIVAFGYVTYELRRRRRVIKPRPGLADVPVVFDSLVKEYKGGYRAVDDISFAVERGQVVGLLGPNGAGKTSALRVLTGLITPTAGAVFVFGQPITPGASVLSRLGAFIEGPGFLPHLTGRENLRLFWEATGRPAGESQLDIALEIAGLGASIDRRVKSYSQGMRQRLGIAQAMLGLPELLVLDEPTNGLDPPQIAEMREVMKRYAETGRTVVVSSHLLGEVEQTCSHIVVMHKGKVVAAGRTDEIAGSDGEQLAVSDPVRAAQVLASAGITATLVPARRALEDVFLDLIGDEGATNV